ncbi:hypothetical protein AMJ51_02040 [Microgenomates bacterium DG_75]|nr:MAG: hypothetical protein AMJ51_02040 [Microgenomates bacterium DG_75]
MKIERLVVGQLQTNCYLVWDEESRQAIIIDPGDDGDYIIRKVLDLQLGPKAIVATHGHVDHILAVTELKLAFRRPFWIHQGDLFLVRRMQASAKHWFGIEVDPPPEIDKFIKEGELIKFGKEQLKVMETPGHSPGGVSLYGGGVLFSGDTLFCRGVGRYDFSYASREDLFASIKNKLFKLPDETRVYPGHGPETTIGEEKESLGFESSTFF